MTPEEKQLLLQDLCARLPYKVKASYYGAEEEMQTYDEIEGVCGDYVEIGQYSLPIEAIKPYLFPLSSMTEKQKIEYNSLRSIGIDEYGNIVYFNTFESVDWFNKNHFDYRGLIPMGLANDATGLNIY